MNPRPCGAVQTRTGIRGRASDLLKYSHRVARACANTPGPATTPGGDGMDERTCSVLEDGRSCGQPIKAHGWCRKHYRRWQVHGDPLMIAERMTPCSCGAGPRHSPVFHRYFDASIRDANGCLIWDGPKEKQTGYGTLGKRTAHRLVYAIYVGPIPSGMSICHHCDNPPCCDPAHLFVGTQGDNIADMVAKGRQHRPKGELSPNAKMTDALVRELRQRHADGERICTLARAFGIDDGTASRIASRQAWGHVE